jgi:pimeloyl-ACP methyl ester carboxylesterase
VGGAGESPDGQGQGSGTGFGISAKPAGAYVIRGDEVKWEPAVDVNGVIAGVFTVVGIALLLALRRSRKVEVALMSMLDVPGATLTYDVRRNDSTSEPILLKIASPMGAAGFDTLSKHFADRTVVIYDPRGSEASVRTDGATQSTPDEHADDLHRIISVLDAGPVDIFARSGGAGDALVLVARHPEQVRTLVAHEPRPPRRCPIGTPLSLRPGPSTRRICAAGSVRAWPTSLRSSATRARYRPISPIGRLPIPPPSDCRPRTMALATSPFWGRTSLRGRTTSSTSTPFER